MIRRAEYHDPLRRASLQGPFKIRTFVDTKLSRNVFLDSNFFRMGLIEKPELSLKPFPANLCSGSLCPSAGFESVNLCSREENVNRVNLITLIFKHREKTEEYPIHREIIVFSCLTLELETTIE